MSTKIAAMLYFYIFPFYEILNSPLILGCRYRILGSIHDSSKSYIDNAKRQCQATLEIINDLVFGADGDQCKSLLEDVRDVALFIISHEQTH